jgi:hypothetical protein
VGDPTIALPNVSALLLGSYYVSTFAKYKPDDFSMTPYYAVFAGGTGEWRTANGVMGFIFAVGVPEVVSLCLSDCEGEYVRSGTGFPDNV